MIADVAGMFRLMIAAMSLECSALMIAAMSLECSV